MAAHRRRPPVVPAEEVVQGSGGGLALIAASVMALVLANSPLAEAYRAALAMPIGLAVGSATFVHAAGEWINDGLMALFFLLVGLEIRREMVAGQLASPRRAGAPVLAALGGMVVPALIYAACNWRDPAALRGWAIPVATDIAFSLAVLRALGRRVPAGVKVFLTALAIIDDLGAIVVIAAFYASTLNFLALAAAGAVWLGLFALNRGGVRSLAPYMIGFAALWACLARSGVQPTLAGVAVALAIPMGEGGTAGPARRLETGLAGWVAYAILPLFGLANAGLRFETLSLGALRDPVVLGIVFGLFAGKQIGVFGTTFAACKLRLVHLPGHLNWRLLYAASVLCGIGFTMSLFIGHLAFHDAIRLAELKAAVFAGSLLSAIAALAVFALVLPRRGRADGGAAISRREARPDERGGPATSPAGSRRASEQSPPPASQ
jgi:NhaA family Na+:H+ antiporter